MLLPPRLAFFLCVASPSCATARWRPRRVRGLDARASGSSIPCGSAGARRRRDRTSPRSASRSLRRRVSASTTRSDSRACVARGPVASPTASVDGRSAWVWGPDGAWPAGPPRRPLGEPSPIATPPRASPPGGGPHRTEIVPDPAASSPASDAAPHPCVNRCRACPLRSAHSSSLSELIMRQ